MSAACKGCKRALPDDRKIPYCRRCHAKRVRDGRLRKESRMFHGVDIDAIHFKRAKV